MRRRFCLLVCLLIVTLPALALELGSPFLDGAILQRGKPVPIWGWSKPGSQVTVEFAGKKKMTEANAKGKWQLSLDPLTASADGRKLTVTGDDTTVSIDDVLVGEVWFASGQSNMDWTAGKSKVRTLASELAKQDLPIREFDADLGSSLFLRSRIGAEDGWKSTRQAGNFSALALAFARDLYEELKVPIGIVRSTHGATPIETWTPYEGFASVPALADIVAKLQASDPRTPASKAAYEQYYQDLLAWQQESAAIVERGGPPLKRPALPGIAEEWKGPTRMYNHKIAPLIPYAIRGTIWCQGTHNANNGRIYADKMHALVNGLRQNWQMPDMPFYFTQMQCYGKEDPDAVGFADIREAQTLFFVNAEKVGMVPQYDLNSARPGGIHYYNKLDPGKRLARWALHHEYGREQLPYAGPIYKSHVIKGNEVRVQFEQRGPGGGLMIGSKGLQANEKENPDSYVEPAKATPDKPLQHVRLAGKDGVWHPAKAVIDGNEVVVTSPEVPKPVGVQYAYAGVVIGTFLYNEAGLPATPFAYFDGKQLFQEDLVEAEPEAKASAPRPSLHPSPILRNGAVLQRGQPVPIWGHATPGAKVTVAFAGQTKTTTAGDYEYWQVMLDPLPASTNGHDLVISTDQDLTRTITDVLVGDVWFLTGSRLLASELLKAPKGDEAYQPPPSLPLVREFRVKTKTRRHPSPRKKFFEIGGGKYVASWQPADFDETGDPPSVFAYHFAKQVQREGVPVGIVTLGAENPPITWVSHAAMQTAKGFEKERDEVNLAFPNTTIAKQATRDYMTAIKQYNAKVAAILVAGDDIPAELAERAPAFPQPPYNQWQAYTETATHTYNFCISPLTPFGVSGVVWVPEADSVPADVARYAPQLEVYANSLANTYGQKSLVFAYAQPADGLVEKLTKPNISGAVAVEFSDWPDELSKLATELGGAVRDSLEK